MKRNALVLALLTGLFFQFQVKAQNFAVVTGIVTTATGSGANQEESVLPYAAVYVNGTTIGSMTNDEGRFTLTNVPSGEQTIEASFIGFESQRIQINVQPGSNNNVEFNLKSASIQGEEVVITAQLLGQRKAMNQQFNSDKIVNVVSEDKIKELPDVNAAEAIGRLPGVAVQRSAGEGQKIMVRGLSPKHTAITINGVKMPSNDPNNKSVDLSLISSDLLSGIEVFKSPTPDMNGDAIGGTVNLVLKKAPEKPQAMFRIGGGYNVQHNDPRNHLFSGQASKRFLDGSLGVIVQGNYERVNRGSDIFGAETVQEGKQNDVFDVISNFVELTDRNEIRTRYGGSLNLDYLFKNHNISWYSLYSRTNRDQIERQAIFQPGAISYDYATQIQDKEIYLDVFSTSVRGEHKFGNLTIDWNYNHSKTNNITPHQLTLVFPYPAYNNDTAGTNQSSSIDDIIANADFDVEGSYLRSLSHVVDTVSETNNTALLNFQYDIEISSDFTFSLKTGGQYTRNDRFRATAEQLQPWYYVNNEIIQSAINRYPDPGELQLVNSNISMASFYDYDYSGGEFLRGDYKFPYVLNVDMTNKFYQSEKNHLLTSFQRLRYPYSLLEQVYAGYLMGTFKYRDLLTIIPGVRYEYSMNDYVANQVTFRGAFGERGSFDTDSTTIDYGEILPHLHMKINPLNSLDIKMSFAKTIARPDYSYVLPNKVYDENNNRLRAGNPGLKHMTALNYDLSVTFMDIQYGLISAGVFYKDLSNVFFIQNGIFLTDSIAGELNFPNDVGQTLYSYNNSDKGKVYGFELELQTNLKMLPSPFDGILIGLNYARLFSETSLSFYEVDATQFLDPNTLEIITTYENIITERDIPIPGQVPHTFNGSVGYEYRGFSGRVSFIYQGEYLNSPNNYEKLDQYIRGFWRTDIALKQHITNNLNIFSNISNVKFANGEHDEYEYYIYKNRPKRYQDYGMIINLGLQFKF